MTKDNRSGWPFVPRSPQAPTQPYSRRAIGDLGPGKLSGQGARFSPAELGDIIQSPDTVAALLAQQAQAGAVSGCNYNLTTVVIPAPLSYEVSPTPQPSKYCAFTIQVFPQNLSRKSLIILPYANDYANNQPVFAVVGSVGVGIMFSSASNTLTRYDMTAAQPIIANTLWQYSEGQVPTAQGFLTTSFIPAPTNPITLVVSFDLVNGGASAFPSPLSITLIEGS
jgi:hypothetical protein